jgi:hypothetical protein
MRYRGLSAWPPQWIKTGGGSSEAAPNILSGEIGILSRVVFSKVDDTRCYILIDFNKEEYMGTLLIEYAGFCRQISSLLQKHLGDSIEKIGSLDLSDLL